MNNQVVSVEENSKERWPLLMIEIILKCYYLGNGYTPSELGTHLEYTKKLEELGLVCTYNKGPYRTTKLGEALVKSILRTPIPRQVYVGADGQIIE